MSDDVDSATPAVSRAQGRAERRAKRRVGRWKRRAIITVIAIAVAAALWFWAFPYLDTFVNDPGVGGV